MKTVLKNHREVCHIWAQQKQAQGRASRVFFDGPSIFSYGRHFEMARFIRPGVVFVTTRGYSVSTSKHISYVRRALSGVVEFVVPSMTDHAENYQYFATEMQKLSVKAAMAVKRGAFYVGEFNGMASQAAAYAKMFKKDIPALSFKRISKDIQVLKKMDFSAIKKNQLQYLKAEKEKKVAERAARDIKYAENLVSWRAGADIRALPEGMFLRVKGEVIETSHGASIPLKLGLVLYERIRAGAAVHGMALDQYTVTGFTEGVLTVGCHKIPMAEMEALYATLAVPA